MVKSLTTATAFCALFLAIASGQQPVTPSATPSPTPEAPAPIEPPSQPAGAPVISPVIPVATAPEVSGSAETPADASVTGSGAAPAVSSISSINATGRAVNEFQGDDVAQVVRLLARQAKINVVVSDKVDASQMKITMRLEDKTPLEAIKVIAAAKGLTVDENDGVYFVKTKEEKESEPTESAFYTLGYATAEKVVPMLKEQLVSKSTPQFDQRTNTIFYRETKSNLKTIKAFLDTIDKPTQQVMIEARLVEVNAHPRQAYGLNWAGVVGSFDSPQQYKFGPPSPANPGNSFFGVLKSQFAILTPPQMSVTMRLLNDDSDVEFLANPRVVTANNMAANIKMVRNQPVPQLNFNAQTATAEFSGFQDKLYGTTLLVTPIINKSNFITMSVKPEISNKIGDQNFLYQGVNVASPIIDSRSLDSNVVIKNGDTLAIGGLLTDQTTKASVKVPIAGDIPVLGYMFQDHANERVKKNLLIFVTPSIIKQGYGTGLEDQVTGMHEANGEEFSNPNGWRNNAKGSLRIVPTSHAPLATQYPLPGYPKPGTPLPSKP